MTGNYKTLLMHPNIVESQFQYWNEYFNQKSSNSIISKYELWNFLVLTEMISLTNFQWLIISTLIKQFWLSDNILDKFTDLHGTCIKS